MGRGVHIGSGCFIESGWAGLTIGDEVEIGPNGCIVSVSYSFELLDQPLQEQGLVTQGIRIGHRARLGAGCVVLDGAEIAKDRSRRHRRARQVCSHAQEATHAGQDDPSRDLIACSPRSWDSGSLPCRRATLRDDRHLHHGRLSA